MTVGHLAPQAAPPSCSLVVCSSSQVGIAIGTIVGAFVLLALVTVVIILVYRRLRYGNYNLLDS